MSASNSAEPPVACRCEAFPGVEQFLRFAPAVPWQLLRALGSWGMIGFAILALLAGQQVAWWLVLAWTLPLAVSADLTYNRRRQQLVDEWRGRQLRGAAPPVDGSQSCGWITAEGIATPRGTLLHWEQFSGFRAIGLGGDGKEIELIATTLIPPRLRGVMLRSFWVYAAAVSVSVAVGIVEAVEGRFGYVTLAAVCAVLVALRTAVMIGAFSRQALRPELGTQRVTLGALDGDVEKLVSLVARHVPPARDA